MPNREPLTDDEILDRIAGWIVRWRMTMPALLYLEGHQHMNVVASNFLVFIQPGLSVLFDYATTDRLIHMMENRDFAERMLVRIEEKDQEHRVKLETATKAHRIAKGIRRVERQSASYARKAARRAGRDKT